MTPTIFQLAYTDKVTGEKKLTRTWYVRYTDENGKQVKKSLSRNKAVAEKMARKILTELDRRKSGLIEPWEEQRKRPLSEHLAEWRTAQEAQSSDPKHVVNMTRMVRRLLDGSGHDVGRNARPLRCPSERTRASGHGCSGSEAWRDCH